MFMLYEFPVDGVSLLLTDLLLYDALCILRRDTSELLGIHLYLDHIAKLSVFIYHEGVRKADLLDGIEHILHHRLFLEYLIIVGVLIYLYNTVVSPAEMVLARRYQRAFDSLKQSLLRNAALFAEYFECFLQFIVHADLSLK